jgi:hypothetical protein
VRTFSNASGLYVDTETDVSLALNEEEPSRSAAYVTVRYVNNLQWWSQPDAAKLRGWVDECLKGTGFKRDGARVEIQSDIRGTRYMYPLKREGDR